jgi:hypothetical protein
MTCETERLWVALSYVHRHIGHSLTFLLSSIPRIASSTHPSLSRNGAETRSAERYDVLDYTHRTAEGKLSGSIVV